MGKVENDWRVDTLALGQTFGLAMADRLPGFLARKAKSGPFERPDPKSLTIEDEIVTAGRNRRQSIERRNRGIPGRAHSPPGNDRAGFRALKVQKAVFGALFTEIAVDPITMEISAEHKIGGFDRSC